MAASMVDLMDTKLVVQLVHDLVEEKVDYLVVQTVAN
jgi:hypothetical protein